MRFHFHFPSPSIARIFFCIVSASFCYVSSSLGSPLSSISLLVLYLHWKLHLNDDIFILSSIRGTLRLKFLVVPFSSIFVCFHWLWLFIDFLFAFCGSDSVRLAPFVSIPPQPRCLFLSLATLSSQPSRGAVFILIGFHLYFAWCHFSLVFICIFVVQWFC